jgi:hypothetical protein
MLAMVLLLLLLLLVTVVVVLLPLLLVVVATIVAVVLVVDNCIKVPLATVAAAVIVAVVAVVVRVRDARSVDDSLGIKPNGAVNPSLSAAATTTTEAAAAAAAAAAPAEDVDKPSSPFSFFISLLGLEGAMTVEADLCNKNERVLSKVRRRRLLPRLAAAEPGIPLVLVLVLPSRGSLVIVVVVAFPPSKSNDVAAVPSSSFL